MVRFGIKYLDPDGPDAPAPDRFDAFYTARGFLAAWITPQARPMRARLHGADGSVVDAVIDSGGFRLEDGNGVEPDVQLWTDVPAMTRLRKDATPLPAHRPTGEPTLTGDDAAVAAFLAAFDLKIDAASN